MHNDDVGRGADTGRHANGRRGRREGEDRAGHEGADGADRQDGWGEDGTQSSHDDLHASTEADSLRAGPAATLDTADRANHRQSSADYRK